MLKVHASIRISFYAFGHHIEYSEIHFIYVQ